MKISYEKLASISIGLLVFAFTTFYFTDGVSKIISRLQLDIPRFSPLVKGFFELLILCYAIITIQKRKVEILLGIFILVIFFFIGQFFLNLTFLQLGFLENFNTLFKYLFPLILYLPAVDVINGKRYPTKILQAYKIIITLNGALILIGLVIDFVVLRTYTGNHRFGYNGLIYAQNEASYIFIFAVAIVYYRRFYLNIKEHFFWIALVPSIFVATKAVYLFLVLLLIFHIVKRVPLRKLIIFSLSIITFGYFLFSTAINKIFINSWNVFLYQYERNGLLSSLLSGRDSFIQDKMKPLIFDYWSFPNFLLGGQDVVFHYIEMGFFDLFLFFGILGSFVYLFLFRNILKLISFKKDFKVFLIISLLILISTAGHFFESGIAGIHFIFLALISTRESLNHEQI